MLFLLKFMLKKPIHIISFDNPFPPDFGGVIDVFFKVKALHEIGFTIYLHCFYQDRNVVSDELKATTERVFLYKKNRNPFFLFSKFPFPVVCRFREELTRNIASIDAPILFEGLHTTMILQKTNLANKKFLRLHNIESNFYAGMSKNETNYFKKIVYHFASKKFIEYQKYKFTAEWFTQLTNKRAGEGKEARNLVLRTKIGYGILGMYNSKVGVSPLNVTTWVVVV